VAYHIVARRHWVLLDPQKSFIHGRAEEEEGFLLHLRLSTDITLSLTAGNSIQAFLSCLEITYSTTSMSELFIMRATIEFDLNARRDFMNW